jgi:hypothetical protein
MWRIAFFLWEALINFPGEGFSGWSRANFAAFTRVLKATPSRNHN